MKQKNLWWIVGILLILIVAGIFFFKGRESNSLAGEQPVTQIQLSGPLADGSAEISGLTWYEDNLILLPQYPNFSDQSLDGFLYYIPKAELLTYLDGANQTPLEPRPIQLIAPDLVDHVRSYQGFEAIGFSGSQAFLTIETGDSVDMQGYLISGTISPDLGVLLLDTSKLAEIAPQSKSENITDESILILNDKILTFYEANGEMVVADPVAHVFDFDLNPMGTIPLENIEYRLTDTAMTSNNEFWGINYFFPGDTALLPISDPIEVEFGVGSTHAQFDHVERLVKFQYSESGITLVHEAPVELSLIEDARNWEGLVVLDDRGFLMATDKFPSTILAFVPLP